MLCQRLSVVHLRHTSQLSLIYIFGAVALLLVFMSLTPGNPLRARSSLVFSAFWPPNPRNTTVQEMKPAILVLSDAADILTTPADSRRDTLGIASEIFVVSLPRRTDRREQMETLRTALGLRWEYVDAVEARGEAVQNIMNHVRMQRDGTINHNASLSTSAPAEDFSWPPNIEPFSSSKPLGLTGSDSWSLPFSSDDSESTSSVSSSSTTGVASAALAHLSEIPLTCTTENDTVIPYTPDLPDYKILTPAKVACWHSHLSVIRRIADAHSDNGDDGVAVILEDDIDMEWDIHEQLKSIWGALPELWDIVFLGHCWSNESHFPALQLPAQLLTSNSAFPQTHLHPSFTPKCTHAYVLTTRGARRLLRHLRHPPFAYSRAIDQAFAWLVESGRLRSYSVVRSVVVQRKLDMRDGDGGSESDVGAGGKASTWKEGLVKGVFGT